MHAVPAFLMQLLSDHVHGWLSDGVEQIDGLNDASTVDEGVIEGTKALFAIRPRG
jgi:hypothetical protein